MLRPIDRSTGRRRRRRRRPGRSIRLIDYIDRSCIISYRSASSASATIRRVYIHTHITLDGDHRRVMDQQDHTRKHYKKKKKEEEASGEQGLRWREKGRLRAGALMAALTLKPCGLEQSLTAHYSEVSKVLFSWQKL
ncbi:hypothetical protein SORBI_3008G133750 [Sorghum bicolor]|uniref:Uncharacterized protein n=1 Tax=Sorghum bicolor TaxID=4558 RepID=A0A1Z5R7L4_SORBI|nr:hypothetical protein SORBI_3008G133750 [Sorghum bicolor]